MLSFGFYVGEVFIPPSLDLQTELTFSKTYNLCIFNANVTYKSVRPL